MDAEVWYEESVVGRIQWIPDAYGIQIILTCTIPCDSQTLLRCYGETQGKPLLIGLPEPQGGRLRLERHLSKETLKAAGCLEAPPTAFYLSDRADRERKQAHAKQKPADLRTGDTVLDCLIDSGTVEVKQDGEAICLGCPFVSDEPFLLAPAFVLCTVEKGKATLRWIKKDAANSTASDKIT